MTFSVCRVVVCVFRWFSCVVGESGCVTLCDKVMVSSTLPILDVSHRVLDDVVMSIRNTIGYIVVDLVV